jgi:hypothetical protein
MFDEVYFGCGETSYVPLHDKHVRGFRVRCVGDVDIFIPFWEGIVKGVCV